MTPFAAPVPFLKRLSALLLLAVVTTMGFGPGLAQAAAPNVDGVKLADSIDMGGQHLQLNGYGIRYKAFFKVYVAALYLNKKTGQAEDVLQLQGAKRMSITMLRDIDAGELGRLFTRGVEDNISRPELAKVVPDLLRMGQLFAAQKQLLKGEVFHIDWVPGVGTVISVKNIQQGEPFKEPEFYKALLRIWLGKHPADAKLKDALLGKLSDTPTPAH